MESVYIKRIKGSIKLYSAVNTAIVNGRNKIKNLETVCFAGLKSKDNWPI